MVCRPLLPPCAPPHTRPAGFWSSGTRLRDAAEVGGGAGAGGELPEYICGGAQTRARPARTRRRRGGPGTTGAQTAKRRKAGSRVTAKDAFGGGGTALNADAEDKKAGAGFRKQAGRSVWPAPVCTRRS
jgi:hypothetical protein